MSLLGSHARNINAANLNAIKALGRSDLFLKLEIIKKVVGLTAVLITMNISVMAMAYSLLVTSVLSQIINSWPNKKLLGYHYLAQLKDMLPQIVLSCIMGAAFYCMQFAQLNDIATQHHEHSFKSVQVRVFCLYSERRNKSNE